MVLLDSLLSPGTNLLERSLFLQCSRRRRVRELVDAATNTSKHSLERLETLYSSHGTDEGSFFAVAENFSLQN